MSCNEFFIPPILTKQNAVKCILNNGSHGMVKAVKILSERSLK